MGRLKNLYRIFFVKHKWATLALLSLLILAYGFCLPDPLFNDPTSVVLEDRNGNLLGAKIAGDGQWRFPQVDSVPEKFEKALLTFEDRRFHSHPGFDIRAFGRAFRQNWRNKKIVSGGSTLTMQVIRLSRKGKSRTVLQKIIEVVLATRLELRCPKSEILALYSSHAPFGGNVVGIDAASWRYFGKSPNDLSWAEAATLAVLPNSPSLIHPGRNREQLRQKRNRLLRKLFELGEIDMLTFDLSSQEPLPERPLALPRLAPHLLERISLELISENEKKSNRVRTTIDHNLQQKVTSIASRKNAILKHNEIHNLAVLVLDVESGEVLAYIGNAPGTGRAHSEDVDIITAPRSTGSILKPLLYCQMLQEGAILPESLIPDIPTYLGRYRPKNFYDRYDGVVSAKRALSRSLNVPFVKMLQTYGVEKFHFDLRNLGLSNITRPPNDYGLSLILGGAETNLWDITNVYACMARRLGSFYENQGKYSPSDHRPPTVYLGKKAIKNSKFESALGNFWGAGEIWLTFQAMLELERPDSEGNWERFQSGQKIAWKTGTSFGLRDAWAIGVSRKYAVGIWVGNADGEGRPGLVGVKTAAPLLFEVFDLLPGSRWFEQPYDAMIQVETCAQSGYLALEFCPKDSIWAPANAYNTTPCPYHVNVHLDETLQRQVNAGCYPQHKIVARPWFILPPTEAHYYKARNPNYKGLPPYMPECNAIADADNNPMELIYPKDLTRILIPIELDGNIGRAIFNIAHTNPKATVHWHVDQGYVQSTRAFHSIELSPLPGVHTLTVVDNSGNRLEQKFEVIAKTNQ